MKLSRVVAATTAAVCVGAIAIVYTVSALGSATKLNAGYPRDQTPAGRRLPERLPNITDWPTTSD